MKRVFFALSAVLAVVCGAVDTGLLKLVPDKYEVAVLVDVSKLLDLPAAKSVLEDQDVAGATSAMARAGVKLSDMKSILVFSVDDVFGAAVKVSNGEKIREVLDNSPSQDGVYVEAMQLNGRRIYRFNATGRSERPVCSFIADDLIIGSDNMENLEKCIAAARIPESDLKRLVSGVPANVTFWGVWRNLEPAPKAEDKAAAERVDAVQATLDFTGAEMRDLDATAEILCGNANFASMLGMMIPGYISIGSGVVFADAPELGEELIKGFKSVPNGRKLSLSLHMSEKLVRHITEFSTRMAKDQVSSAVKADAPAAQSTAPAAQSTAPAAQSAAPAAQSTAPAARSTAPAAPAEK